MIGVLIISHGGLGEAMIHAASHVLGDRPVRLQQVGIGVDDDPEAMLGRARTLVRQLDDGAGVLVLTDIYGATPGNIALKVLEPGRVEGISGLSLPLLVRALSYRDLPLAAVVDKALSGGREGVLHMTTDCCGADRRR